MSAPKRRRDEDVSDAPLTLREAETSLRGAAALREALERHSYAVVALDAADALACAICHAHGGLGMGALATAGMRRRGGRMSAR